MPRRNWSRLSDALPLVEEGIGEINGVVKAADGSLSSFFSLNQSTDGPLVERTIIWHWDLEVTNKGWSDLVYHRAEHTPGEGPAAPHRS